MSKGVFVTNEQVRLTGSRNAALFLAQCLYWSGIDLVKKQLFESFSMLDKDDSCLIEERSQ